jgi:hypothetical protein
MVNKGNGRGRPFIYKRSLTCAIYGSLVREPPQIHDTETDQIWFCLDPVGLASEAALHETVDGSTLV